MFRLSYPLISNPLSQRTLVLRITSQRDIVVFSFFLFGFFSSWPGLNIRDLH